MYFYVENFNLIKLKLPILVSWDIVFYIPQLYFTTRNTIMLIENASSFDMYYLA